MKEITEEEAREFRWHHVVFGVIIGLLFCFAVRGCLSDLSELERLRKEVAELRQQVHGYKLKETK